MATERRYYNIAGLFYFDFDPANPAGDQIVNGGEDYAENKSEHPVEDGQHDPEPKHHAAEESSGRVRPGLVLLRRLRERAGYSGEGKDRQEDQAHASVEDAQHLAGLEGRDSLNSPLHGRGSCR